MAIARRPRQDVIVSSDSDRLARLERMMISNNATAEVYRAAAEADRVAAAEERAASALQRKEDREMLMTFSADIRNIREVLQLPSTNSL